VDKQEFQVIYDTYSRPLYTFILWMTRNRAAAQDILQTVLVKVWNQGGGPEDPDGRRRWLYAVARNACLDSFRAAARLNRFRASYRAEYEEEDPSGGSENAEVWNLLSELTETDRSILYLHLKTGYSYAEIGEVLSLTETHVRVRAFRALKRLREIMAKEQR
jgi:RNA polymerase sigma-70 factor, ECF subfamily